MRKTGPLMALLLCFIPLFLGAQEAPDPASLIGLSLEELIAAYGVPRSVEAVRGNELWQDDVVFVYDEGDFYILGSRVWQLGLEAAYGIRRGDREDTVRLILGDEAVFNESYILYSLPSRSWPLKLRINLNESRTVSAIYVYRSDL